MEVLSHNFHVFYDRIFLTCSYFFFYFRIFYTALMFFFSVYLVDFVFPKANYALGDNVRKEHHCSQMYIQGP